MRNYGHDQVTSWQQAVRQTAETRVVKPTAPEKTEFKLEKIEVEHGLRKWLRLFSSRAER